MCSTLDQVSLPLAPCQPLGRWPSPGTCRRTRRCVVLASGGEAPAATQNSSTVAVIRQPWQDQACDLVKLSLCDLQGLTRWLVYGCFPRAHGLPEKYLIFFFCKALYTCIKNLCMSMICMYITVCIMIHLHMDKFNQNLNSIWSSYFVFVCTSKYLNYMLTSLEELNFCLGTSQYLTEFCTRIRSTQPTRCDAARCSRSNRHHSGHRSGQKWSLFFLKIR